MSLSLAACVRGMIFSVIAVAGLATEYAEGGDIVVDDVKYDFSEYYKYRLQVYGWRTITGPGGMPISVQDHILTDSKYNYQGMNGPYYHIWTADYYIIPIANYYNITAYAEKQSTLFPMGWEYAGPASYTELP